MVEPQAPAVDFERLIQDLGPLPSSETPRGEALRWWVDRIRRNAYVGLRSQLPSAQAVRVLRDQELIAQTPGEWGFVVRTPVTLVNEALRRNAWALVAAIVERYAPAVVDRASAIRLMIGDESLTPVVYVRHGSSDSRHEWEIMPGHKIVLSRGYAPSVTPGTPTVVTLSHATALQIPVMNSVALLMTLTLSDIRENLDAVVVWLRTLVVGRTALEEAYTDNQRHVLLTRMGKMARAAGNNRLADTIGEVLNAHHRTAVSRSHTRIGQEIIIPAYLSSRPPSGTPWLERHRVRQAHLTEAASALLWERDARLRRLATTEVLTIARAAKVEDTYHSTTIEGYRITREDVIAVISGARHQGRSAAEIERLMALKGYASAFDLTLARLEAAQPSTERPPITEALILDLFIELWSPSIDAGIVTAPQLRDWRNHAVQINGSDYAPPAWEKLLGLMSQFVEQLNAADVGPLTRAVIAHWAFVHLHPFKDGNGRISRLLMNYVLGAAGLPWTTIRSEDQKAYFAALESAHILEDIAPFATFVADAVERAYSFA